MACDQLRNTAFKSRAREIPFPFQRMGVDTGGGALGAEAPPDFQALQYIQYTCMETNS